ncbi:hypothetical protein V6N11_004182 [Hibiscus sabdariffa]|uniref:Arf-GAP domain-containing protein n=1 Tax=Hibiscus sabdariffa TaxID=183260 RepID=A0ABR2SFP2_9ROSI
MSTQYEKSDSKPPPDTPRWDRPSDAERFLIKEWRSFGARARLERMLEESGNRVCADCGSPDPKWVSLSIGVFICIKCSGVHRSLGSHISKVLSVKLDEWTDEQVDSLVNLGGNNVVNNKYEALLPDNHRKPKPDSPIEERSDFIRRKYEMQQFLEGNEQTHQPTSPSSLHVTTTHHFSDKKHSEKHGRHRIGHRFRNSWGRKHSEKSNSLAGMVEFIGLIKVNVVKGTNLAVRDILTSDPYVILSLGQQLVYDKDTFTPDDFMGDAEIDIQPLVFAARAYEKSEVQEPTQLGKWVANKDNPLTKDGIITLMDGKVKQEISFRLQNVERGTLEIELECIPLTQ